MEKKILSLAKLLISDKATTILFNVLYLTLFVFLLLLVIKKSL
jgi:hypothetical protein